MPPDLLILTIAFFIIAMIYSSVGFGGGSSYLALLAVMNLPFDVIRPAALLCNIVVVSSGAYIFWRSGALDVKRSFVFLLASTPMAFLGGMWDIGDDTFFFTVLGLCLIAAAFLLWVQTPASPDKKTDNPMVNASLGAGIGFLSGYVGIGGGIFLSPILNLLNWAEARKIAGLASLFILVNSLAGLAGQMTNDPHIEWSFIVPLLVAVFLGGQAGARIGARRLNPVYVKRVTAIVIFIAAIKILKDHL